MLSRLEVEHHSRRDIVHPPWAQSRLNRTALGRASRAARCSAESAPSFYETIDHGLEVGDGTKDSTLQASAGELGEEASTAFSQELGRCEVEGLAQMAHDPSADFSCLWTE